MKVNHLKAGVILSWITVFLNCCIGIFFTPFMVRSLGQSEYGLYQLMGSFVGYMSILDFGLGNAIVRYVAQYREQHDKKSESNFLAMVIILYLFIALAIFIIGSVLYFNLHWIFGKSLSVHELSEAKIMFAILVVNLAVSLPGGAFNAITMGYEVYIFPRTISLVRIILRYTILVVLLVFGLKAIAIVILDTILNAAIIFININICWLKLKVKIKLYKFDKSLLAEIFNFSFYVFVSMIVWQIIWNSNQMIIGIKMSASAVAIYMVGAQFSNIFSQLSESVSNVFLPKVTRMVTAGANNKLLTNFMIKIGRIQGLMIIYIYIAYILFGRQFIKLWVGNGYEISWVSSLLFMGGFLIPYIEVAGVSIIQAKRKLKFYVLTQLGTAIVGTAAAIFITDLIGIPGPALMTMITLIVFQLIIVNTYYKKVIGLDMFRFFVEVFNGILPMSVLSGVLGYILILIINVTSWTKLLIDASLYSLIFFTVMWFFGVNQYEKNLVLEPIRRFYPKKKRLKNNSALHEE